MNNNKNTDTIRLIGYWKSQFQMKLPHPINFIDSKWDQTEKNKVIAYIKNAPFLPAVAGGYSYCRLCNKEDNGCREQSDGYFIWSEGFLHYLEEHNVKPPKDFIDHCIKSPKAKKINLEQEVKIDTEWWKEQRGFETPESKYFLDPYEHTYPKFYSLELKNFNKNNLKLKYRKLLKDIAKELDMSVIEIHHNLTNSDKEFIVSEEDINHIEKIINKDLFLDIKRIKNIR
ncbi:hypothetical protein [Tenacibaculum sp. M341]|uniref:hypothetical protein n=1 Tax=Tenacibaculum sp. M341 TaxID=2530339 RepID=UPI0010D52FFE|nr:hypothetical protein [Tenacibaculum sp. M341]TCI89987.1 hypothetical protein EYW44_15080 [Tenacibaculum sp. M341]